MVEQATVEVPWLRIARGEIGVRELPGGPNVRVRQYLDTVGGAVGDDWCSAFLQWVMSQAGIAGPGKPTARAWRRWSQSLSQPRVGCVAVLWRETPNSWKGHVGLFLSESPKMVTLLGGNQGGQVCIRRYPKARLLAYRWPP